jgi:hypothetical protein
MHELFTTQLEESNQGYQVTTKKRREEVMRESESGQMLTV